MFRFITNGSERKVLASLLALLVITLSFSVIFNPTQISASTLHPTGLLMEDEIPFGVTAAPALDTSNLPSYFDLSYYFPNVGNQGSQGSCVAFATGYAALTYKKAFEVNRHGSLYYFEDDNNVFSPSFIYNQIHVLNTSDGGGAFFEDAFNLLREQGCVSLAEMPYSGLPYDYNTMPTSAQLQSAAKNRIFSWEYLPAGNVDQIRATLAQYNPVVIGIPVYPDFDNLSPSNDVYDSIYGYSRGNHALCLVGYDDEKQAFKFINSWGTDWGINGFGWISYGLIEYLNVVPYSFPVAPGNFRMTNSSGLSIEFTWNSVPNKRYAVYRRPTGSTEEYTKILETTQNVVSVATLFGSYDYCAAIVDQYGNRLSGFSRVCTVERFLNSTTDFRMSNSSCDTIQFTWSGFMDDRVPGAKYAIFSKPTGSTEAYTKEIETTNNVVSVTAYFGSYDYCVALLDSNGNRVSHYSNIRTVERFLNGPANFRVSNINGMSVEFTWDKEAGRSYAIYRKPTGSTEQPTKIAEAGTNNVVTVTTLSGSYDYSVAMVDSNGYRISYFSNICTIQK